MSDEELSLVNDVKGYSVKELVQLQKITQEVKDHWVKMLLEIPETKPGLRMAVEASITQAEDDLKVIADEIRSR